MGLGHRQKKDVDICIELRSEDHMYEVGDVKEIIGVYLQSSLQRKSMDLNYRYVGSSPKLYDDFHNNQEIFSAPIPYEHSMD